MASALAARMLGGLYCTPPGRNDNLLVVLSVQPRPPAEAPRSCAHPVSVTAWPDATGQRPLGPSTPSQEETGHAPGDTAASQWVRFDQAGAGAMVQKMRADKEIAQAANAERRAIGKEFKDQTDPELRDVIYRRNQEKYGDPLGPKYEDLQRGYAIGPKGERVPISKDGKPVPDSKIIESAQNPGGGDFPWDAIMEYQRAKRAGDPKKAQQLLQQIDAIVNKKK